MARITFEQSQNQMALWFAVSIVDHLFRTRWSIISPTDRDNIRKYLFQYLCNTQQKLSDFVSKSLANLIVRIAVLDWPSEQPTFLNDVFELLKDPQKR